MRDGVLYDHMSCGNMDRKRKVRVSDMGAGQKPPPFLLMPIRQ